MVMSQGAGLVNKGLWAGQIWETGSIYQEKDKNGDLLSNLSICSLQQLREFYIKGAASVGRST